MPAASSRMLPSQRSAPSKAPCSSQNDGVAATPVGVVAIRQQDVDLGHGAIVRELAASRRGINEPARQLEALERGRRSARGCQHRTQSTALRARSPAGVRGRCCSEVPAVVPPSHGRGRYQRATETRSNADTARMPNRRRRSASFAALAVNVGIRRAVADARRARKLFGGSGGAPTATDLNIASLQAAGERLGVGVERLPGDMLRLTHGGEVSYAYASNLAFEPLVPFFACGDKGLTAARLAEAGLPVPRSAAFELTGYDRAQRFFAQLDKPVVTKPARGTSGGAGGHPEHHHAAQLPCRICQSGRPSAWRPCRATGRGRAPAGHGPGGLCHRGGPPFPRARHRRRKRVRGIARGAQERAVASGQSREPAAPPDSPGRRGEAHPEAPGTGAELRLQTKAETSGSGRSATRTRAARSSRSPTACFRIIATWRWPPPTSWGPCCRGST